MFGATASSQPSNEPAKLDVEVHPPPPPPSKPNRKGLSSIEKFVFLIFDIGAPSSPPPKQQLQFDPQSKETDHDKATLVVRGNSDA